jgi:hypothetical protein
MWKVSSRADPVAGEGEDLGEDEADAPARRKPSMYFSTTALCDAVMLASIVDRICS